MSGRPATWSSDDWAGERAERWASVADRIEVQIAPVNEPLFAAAALRPGEAVLDVGCGRGVTTRRAAELVGPDGQVTGLDIAPALLAEARRAPGDGAPIDYVVGDAQTHPLAAATYDAVISRFGVMFFGDPVAAFANLRAATRPGGRLAVAVWQPRERSTVMQRSVDVALAAADAAGVTLTPPAPDTGPFGFGDRAAVEEILVGAGWSAVGFAPHTLDMYAGGPGTVEEIVETAFALGALREMLVDAPAVAVEVVRRALTDDVAAHHDGTGLLLTGAIALVTATAP